LSAQVADGSFAKLLAAASSNTAASAPLPEALQQALDASLAAAAAAAAAGAGSSKQAGPQLPPELVQLARELSDPQTGVPSSTRPGDLRSNAFTGRALLDWLQQHSSSNSSSSGDRTGALQTGQQLLAANVVTLVSQQQPSAPGLSLVDDDSHWYRLRSDAPRDLSWGSALNTGYWWGPAPARPAGVVAEDLRGRILALYDKHLSSDGKAVRYKALKQDPAFWEYVDATAELQRVSCGEGGRRGGGREGGRDMGNESSGRKGSKAAAVHALTCSRQRLSLHSACRQRRPNAQCRLDLCIFLPQLLHPCACRLTCPRCRVRRWCALPSTCTTLCAYTHWWCTGLTSTTAASGGWSSSGR
jgi:hypothetical protein